MNFKTQDEGKTKSWWRRLLEKLDKALLEKSKKSSSGCDPKAKGGKCC